MDPEWTYATFCEEAGFSATHGMVAAARRPRSPAPRTEPDEARDIFANAKTPFLPKSQPIFGGIEAGALSSVAVLLVLIGALGYGGVAVFREVQKVQFTPVDQAPEVLAEIDPLDGAFRDPQADPQAPSPLPSAEALDRLYRPKALDVPVLTARDGPIASLDPRTFGTLAPGPRAIRQAEAVPPPSLSPDALQGGIDAALLAALGETAPAAGPESPVVTAPADLREVALIAVQPSWVRVRAADGTVLFEKILDAGERYVLPDIEGVPTLRAGNAGSLYFAVNGQTYGPAGDGPSVVKNVALSAEDLAGTYALADPSRDTALARYYAQAPDPAPASE
jgi:hypothetical protein